MKKWGIIGYPVAHSKSPLIHNTWYQIYKEQLIENLHYDRFEIFPENFTEQVKKLKNQPAFGFNVTYPYKEMIISFLDEIDEHANRIQAVNTIVIENGKWIGRNTDGIGFYDTIHPLSFQKNSRILIIGAGATARSIFFTLLQKEFTHIDLCNRSINTLRKIHKNVNGTWQGKMISLEDASKHLSTYDLVIQSTPVGMDVSNPQSPIQCTNMNPKTTFYDVIYHPEQTYFLQQASEKGADTINGLGMLYSQAAHSFQLWTGIHPDLQSVRIQK